MQNTSKMAIGLFFFFILLAVATVIGQIYYSGIRPLTPLENSLIFAVALAFSTVSGWYFSKIYSQNTDIEKVIEQLIKVLEGSYRIGLVSIEPQLRSGTTTTDALQEVSTSFDFLGIGGSKFIPQMFDEKTNIGRFIAKNRKPSDMRMMFLDPDSELIGVWMPDKEKAKKVRQSIRSSLNILANQIKMGRKFQVRLYDFTPPMRLQIIDREKAFLCEYDILSDGWDAPQLCFAKKGQKPLLNSLTRLFDHFWDNAKEFEYEKFLS